MRPPHAVALVLAAAVGLAAAPLPVAAHVNHVSADPQASSDGTLVAETAYVANDGHLVVHRDDGGEVGEPVGHVPLSADGGLQTDVGVRIDGAAWDDWDARHAWLVLHTDDGDGRFEPDEDPVLRTFGQVSGERIAVARGDRALVTARGFAPQRVDETNRSVLVRNATLPADGALVVRNASDGRVLARTSLSAGSHRNVTLALPESFVASHDRFTAEAALVNGTGEPVTAGGAPVATTFGVRTLGGDASATGTAGVTTPSATAGGAESDATDRTATGDTPGSGTGVGGPGFGAQAALASLALLALSLGVLRAGVVLTRGRCGTGGDERG